MLAANLWYRVDSSRQSAIGIFFVDLTLVAAESSTAKILQTPDDGFIDFALIYLSIITMAGSCASITNMRRGSKPSRMNHLKWTGCSFGSTWQG